jgi:hypothetical protein
MMHPSVVLTSLIAQTPPGHRIIVSVLNAVIMLVRFNRPGDKKLKTGSVII